MLDQVLPINIYRVYSLYSIYMRFQIRRVPKTFLYQAAFIHTTAIYFQSTTLTILMNNIHVPFCFQWDALYLTAATTIFT